MIEFNVSVGKSPQINSDTGGISQKYAENTYEKKENKVTSLSAESTNEQYPSAKVVYDTINATSNTIEDKITKSISSVMTYKGSITADNIASIYSDTVASVVSELKTGYTFNLTSTWKNDYIPLVCLKIPSGFTVSLSHNQDGYNMYQIYFTPTNAELWKTKSYWGIFNKTTGKLCPCVYYSMGEYDNKYQVVAKVSENDVSPTTTDELYWGEFDNAVVGDNIAWNGTQFDILSGYIDTSDFATKTQLSDTKAELENDINTKLSNVYKYVGNITSGNDITGFMGSPYFPQAGSVYNIDTNNIFIPTVFLCAGTDSFMSNYNPTITLNSDKTEMTLKTRNSGALSYSAYDFNNTLLIKMKKTDNNSTVIVWCGLQIISFNYDYNADGEGLTATYSYKELNNSANTIDLSTYQIWEIFKAEICSKGDNVASKWDGRTSANRSSLTDEYYYTFDKLAATVDLSSYATKDELNSKQDKLDPQKIPVSADNITTPKTGDMRFKLGDSMTYDIELYTTQWDELSVGCAIQAFNATIAQRALFDGDGDAITGKYATKTAFEQFQTSVQIKCTVVDLDNESQSSMPNNFVFNFGEQTAITVTLPTTIANDYISGFTFVSGATPTSLTMPTEIKFSGVDCFDGSFTPTANKTYQVIISRVANEFWGDVDARDYEAPTEETT